MPARDLSLHGRRGREFWTLNGSIRRIEVRVLFFIATCIYPSYVELAGDRSRVNALRRTKNRLTTASLRLARRKHGSCGNGTVPSSQRRTTAVSKWQLPVMNGTSPETAPANRTRVRDGSAHWEMNALVPSINLPGLSYKTSIRLPSVPLVVYTVFIHRRANAPVFCSLLSLHILSLPYSNSMRSFYTLLTVVAAVACGECHFKLSLKAWLFMSL